MKVAVFCCAGMSTSLLVKKVRVAAEKRGVEIDIEAYPESEMSKQKGLSCALLGPQIMYLAQKAKGIFNPQGVPCEVINSVDYGMMNGEKILDYIIKLSEK